MAPSLQRPVSCCQLRRTLGGAVTLWLMPHQRLEASLLSLIGYDWQALHGADRYSRLSRCWGSVRRFSTTIPFRFLEALIVMINPHLSQYTEPRRPHWLRLLVSLSVPLLVATAWSTELPAQTAELKWGGEGWAAHARTVNTAGVTKVYSWLGGGGGRIHYSHDAAPIVTPAVWMDANVPADATGHILDIWFDPTGITGFACGRGGRILKSKDAGKNWFWFGATVKDFNGDPASLWGVRPVTLDGKMMFVTGLWCLRYTVDAGANWKDITVFDAPPSQGGQIIPHMKLEAFKMDLIRTSQGVVAAVGAEHEDPSNPIVDQMDVPVFPYGGVVLYTDSRLADSKGGTQWWIVSHDMRFPATAATGTVPASPIMVEPWSLRFEMGASGLDSARGIVIGGRGGNEGSRWWTTQDSGRTWTHNPSTDFNAGETMYDAATTASGEAAIVGYSGRVVRRDSATAPWVETVLTSPGSVQPSPMQNTSALGGAAGFQLSPASPLGLLVSGDFGTRRISRGYVGSSWSWEAASPLYPNLTELEFRGVDFDCTPAVPGSAGVGLMAGQSGRIYRTVDGGVTWSDSIALLPVNCNAIAMNTTGIALMVGDSSRAEGSVDFGASWAPVNTGQSGVKWTEVALAQSGSVAVVVGKIGSAQIVRVRDANGIWAGVAPPATGLSFEAVQIDTSGNAIVVGRTGSGLNAHAVAYKLNLPGSTWQVLTLPASVTSATSELLDISCSDGSARCLAVGDWSNPAPTGKRGLVLELIGTSFFVPAFLTDATNLDIPLRAVDVSPSGNRVLIGGDYLVENDEVADAGILLVQDGGVWSRTRAKTGKGLTSMRFLTEGKAFGLGLTGNQAQASFINAQLASTALIEVIWNP